MCAPRRAYKPVYTGLSGVWVYSVYTLYSILIYVI